MIIYERVRQACLTLVATYQLDSFVVKVIKASLDWLY